MLHILLLNLIFELKSNHDQFMLKLYILFFYFTISPVVYQAFITNHTCVVPTFTIDPPERNVSEPDGPVMICVTTESPLGRQVVVTAVTGMKSDADDDAEG